MLKSEKKVNNHLIFRSVISPILAASFGIFILGYISATVKQTNQIEQNESRLNSILLLVAGVAEAPEAINDLVNSLGIDIQKDGLSALSVIATVLVAIAVLHIQESKDREDKSIAGSSEEVRKYASLSFGFETVFYLIQTFLVLVIFANFFEKSFFVSVVCFLIYVYIATVRILTQKQNEKAAERHQIFLYRNYRLGRMEKPDKNVILYGYFSGALVSCIIFVLFIILYRSKELPLGIEGKLFIFIFNMKSIIFLCLAAGVIIILFFWRVKKKNFGYWLNALFYAFIPLFLYIVIASLLVIPVLTIGELLVEIGEANPNSFIDNGLSYGHSYYLPLENYNSSTFLRGSELLHSQRFFIFWLFSLVITILMYTPFVVFRFRYIVFHTLYYSKKNIISKEASSGETVELLILPFFALFIVSLVHSIWVGYTFPGGNAFALLIMFTVISLLGVILLALIHNFLATNKISRAMTVFYSGSSCVSKYYVGGDRGFCSYYPSLCYLVSG